VLVVSGIGDSSCNFGRVAKRGEFGGWGGGWLLSLGWRNTRADEGFMLVVTCQRAAKSSAMSCELIRCSFSES